MNKWYIEKHLSVIERYMTVGFDHLTPVEKHCFSLEAFFADFFQDGLSAFFQRNSSVIAENVLSAFQAIGAQQKANLYKEMLLKAYGKIPNPDDVLSGGNDIDDAYFNIEFSKIREPVNEMMEAYLNVYDDKILGPRSHSQLIASRKQRG